MQSAWLRLAIFAACFSSCLGVIPNPVYPKNVTIPENTPKGTVIANVTDGDHNEVSIISVQYANGGQEFFVNNSAQRQWDLVLNTSLDYEGINGLKSITAILSIRGQEGIEVRIPIYVISTDVNDNDPQFQDLPYNAQVLENAKPGPRVIKINATDRDDADNAVINFDMKPVAQDVTSGNRESTLFFIDSKSGVITLNGTLDYESTTFYHYKVIAKDNGTPSRTSTTDLFITVQDVQDTPPVFLNSPYTATIPDNATKNTYVLTVKAIDGDRAIPDTVQYSINDTNCQGWFSLNLSSGIMAISAASLDYEQPVIKDRSGICTFTIQATEVTRPAFPQIAGSSTSNTSATITIQDVNNHPPKFTNNSAAATINENSPADTPLTLSPVINVTDNDVGANSNIRLSISSEGDCFDLVAPQFQSAGTVMIRVKKPEYLDFEKRNSVTINITATDGTNPASGSVRVTVTVLNVNEYAPQFNKSQYDATVPEGTKNGTIVANLTAFDSDKGDYGKFNYSLSNSDMFNIDAHTGVVTTVSEQIDREKQERYYIVVTATDWGGLKQTTRLDVTVRDLNDNPPVFVRDEYEPVLQENSKMFSRPVVLQAADADKPGTPNSNVTYRLTGTLPSNLQGHFRLDQITGNLTVYDSLDFEAIHWPADQTPGTIKLYLQALDHGTTQHITNLTLNVQLQDVDDNPPKFVNASTFAAQVQENSPAGTLLNISTMTVMDIDQNEHADFSLVLSDYVNCLDVFPSKARSQATILLRVTNQSCFDYEHVQSLNFSVKAKADHNSSSSSTATVHLVILNVNDESPEFNTSSASVSIQENLPNGNYVYLNPASDKDLPPYNNITYSLQGGDGAFNIGKNTGTVTVAAQNKLDYETRQTFQLTVSVTDSGNLRNDMTLTVNLKDVNDNAPIFQITEYQGYATENKKGLSPSVVVEAKDADGSSSNNQITYSLHTPGYASKFCIDPRTGNLTLNASLDYETIPHGVITLMIWAVDNGQHNKTGSATVTIHVQDINDWAPKFNSSLYKGNVNEDLPAGVSVATVHANDSDGSAPNNAVFYIISSGSGDNFQINSSSGVITTTNKLDREKIAGYNLTVYAVDRGTPAMTGTTTVSIDVNNINDDPPKFDADSFTVRVPENLPPGSSVFNMTAKDGDSDARLSYSILGLSVLKDNSNASVVFVGNATLFNNATGAITINRGLDREAVDKAVLTIRVEDLNAANQTQTATSTLSIFIDDVDDNKPSFNSIQFSASVDENSIEGTVLHMAPGQSITVQDPDLDQNADFNISVNAPYDKYFKVEPASARSFALAQIHVLRGADLDYERNHNLTFTITARATHNFTAQNTATVTLYINDINDNDPVFDNVTYHFTVPENSQRGVSISSVKATDDDSGIFSTISYSLEGDHASFLVEPGTGVLKTADKLDREERDTYLMTLVATDGGGRRTAQQVTITVTDVNDNAPVFRDKSYSARVQENSLLLEHPVLVVTTDIDQSGTNNSLVTYLISSCNKASDCKNFSVDATTGNLTLVAPLDFERVRTVDIVVVARDHGITPMSSNVTVTLEIEDVNDVKPVFSNTTYANSVLENSETGVSVASVNATDGDGSEPNNVVFYVLETGKGADNFQVNSSTGLISVGPGAVLDREVDSSGFTLIVLGLDRGDPPLTATATVSINLTDVNDEPPRFDRPLQDVTVLENATVGYLVANVTATDPDTGSQLVYTWLLDQSSALTDRDAKISIHNVSSWFTVNVNTGQVTVAGNLDRETAQVVVMAILVNDTTGTDKLPQTATATLHITLGDCNDNVPVIQGSTTLQVSEAVALGTVVSSLTATDADSFQTVTFSIRSPDSHFNISNTGKLTLSKNLDREAYSSVSVVVVATDSGSPPLSSSIVLNVTVLDSNDHDPEFENATYTFRVLENATSGTTVAKINATDEDEGPNALVTFFFADNVNDFAINSTNGVITVLRSLDREARDSYPISLAAMDNPATEKNRRAVRQATIVVMDVNDNSPQWVHAEDGKRGYSAMVEETKPAGQKVTIMTPGPIAATDEDSGDNARLTYNMTYDSNETAEAESFFLLNAVTGEITVNKNISGHAGLYNYTLTVTDHGDPAFSNQTSLVIEIRDENTHTPQFISLETNILVQECSKPGTSLTQFQTKDDDSDKLTNGKVFVDLQAAANEADLKFFKINRESGALTTQLSFQRQPQKFFQFRVQAVDNGIPQRFSPSLLINVSVNDGNDNPAKFIVKDYYFNVTEGSSDVILGSVMAVDADEEHSTCYSFPDSSSSELFQITDKAQLKLKMPLDREKASQAYFSFQINAWDCTGDRGGCLNDSTISMPSQATVHITVEDVNDNAPTFQKPQETLGLPSTADTGHVIINLPDYVNDPDLGPNRVHTFTPVGSFRMDQHLASRLDPKVPYLSLTGNGTLTSGAAFAGDVEGVFNWTIVASDAAGNSSIFLKIYLVAEDKLIRITFFKSQEQLRHDQEYIIGNMSQKMGINFTADDHLPYKDERGVVDPSKSVLLVHALNTDEQVMLADRLRDELDHKPDVTSYLQQAHQLMSVQTYLEAKQKAASQTRLDYILAGIIAVLLIAFAITLFLMVNNIRRFKRKLKAATTETYALKPSKSEDTFPGLKTPQTNPIFNKEDELAGDMVYDQASMNSGGSLDDNSVHSALSEDRGEDEQEVTMEFRNADDQPGNRKDRGRFTLSAVLDHHDLVKGRASAEDLTSQEPEATEGSKRPRKLYKLEDSDGDDLSNCETTDI